MIKYDLVKRTAEFNRRDRREIKQGCTALDPDPEYIKTFDDLEEAKKELAKRKTSVSKFENHNMTFYSVEEYVIEENEFEFDEDEGKLVQPANSKLFVWKLKIQANVRKLSCCPYLSS